MEQNERKKVLIAVPTMDWKITTGLGDLFAAAKERNYVKDYPWHFTHTTCHGVKGYDAARNTILKRFLDGDCDYLWMIDQDMQPEPDIFGLLDTDADIIAPLLPTLKIHIDYDVDSLRFDIPFCACRYRDIDDLGTVEGVDVSVGGIMDVDGVGFGCVLIKRAVLEDKRMRHDKTYQRIDGKSVTLRDDEPPPVFKFHRKAHGCIDIGEDFEFCWRAKRLGYSVKLDTGILIGHMRDHINLAHLLDFKAFVDKYSRSEEEKTS